MLSWAKSKMRGSHYFVTRVVDPELVCLFNPVVASLSLYIEFGCRQIRTPS